ncbi:23S rRNA (uracil(1939)-C(5))-methyltransferase RlmD [Candidatus Woesearchaeota archaeon]|nr:23S rRNA (uracil(1939)-C(5))-methyltransferase RlmD [Candidatus Woesearchaeota archaeon]
MVEQGATLPLWTGKIEGLTQEGLGVGTSMVSHAGKQLKRPIFVPFTVPGDVVKAKIVQQRGKYSFAQLVEITQPSPDRVPSRCPHYGICGGCNLQHVKYEKQLEEKSRQVEYLLKRKGIELPSKVKIWPSRKMQKYRWRSRIAVQFTNDGVTAGFRKFRSRDIVKVEKCFIVASQIVELITIINDTKIEVPAGEVEVTAVVGEKGKVGILLHLDELPEEFSFPVRSFFTDVYARHRELIGNLFFEQDGKTKTIGQVQSHIFYSAGGCKFMFLPETFIQANVLTNDLLIKRTMEFLKPGKKDVILDLYAGIGNFSLPAAKECSKVVAVERHAAAVAAGETNALQNGLDNVKFLPKTAERYLHELVQARKKPKDEYPIFTKLLVDPARGGLSEKARKEILSLGIPSVVYVSCNPVTLAEDLAFLQLKYKVTKILGVDMFPDVSHVETVVLLEHK